MAITIRHALNAAIQYNEVDLTDYLVNDAATGKKFLTEAALTRILRATEAAALYFACNDTSFSAGALYRFYDSNGVLVYHQVINLSGSEAQNALPVNSSMFDQPSDVAKVTVTIIGGGEEISNGDFELGSGDTFTDWTKVLTSATNEIIYSQRLDESGGGLAWSANFPVTANATTAPDGTTTADKIVEDTCSGCYAFITQQTNLSVNDWTFSCYMKAAERTIGYLTLQDGNTAEYFVTWFDLANSLVLTNQNDSAGIEEIGNGWYRCYITKNNIDMTSGALVQISPTDDDGVEIYDCVAGNGIFAWGAQLEIGDTMTSYKATVATAVTADEGSIVQAQRTNLVSYSEQFNNAYWDKLNGTVSTNAVNSPIGTLTAEEYIANNGSGNDRLIGKASISYTASQYYISSVYAKKKDFDWVIVYGINFNVVWFNINTGTVGNVGANVQGFIEDASNGWYRLIVVSRAFTGSGGIFYFGPVNSNGSLACTSDGTKGTYFWGAQFETSIDYASSYIATTITSLTIADGRNGTRAPRFNRESLAVALYQVATTIGVEYRLQFWAKYYEGFPEISINDGFVDYETFPITSEEYELHDVTFTATTDRVYISVSSGNYSAVAVDDVSMYSNDSTELTETRTFIYDDECVANEVEVNWLNKLGGRDSWVFTGFPIDERVVNRVTPIEYSKRTNFSSPNRIYGNRQNMSRKSLTVVHKCKDRTTAEWLRSEIIDSIDVMVREGGEYYPVEVTNSSIVVNDTFSQDYTVRFIIRYAYDINIQTR